MPPDRGVDRIPIYWLTVYRDPIYGGGGGDVFVGLIGQENVIRESVNSVARTKGAASGQATTTSLGTFGRYAGPATLILSSLAQGPKHGYALTKDIEEFAGLRLAPGTLYEALSRLEHQRLIEAIPSDDRRKPYKLTTAGADALRTHLSAQRDVAEVGLTRLAGNWGAA